MGTKNNPQNRGEVSGIKTVGGKVVKPVYYIGKNIGHGNYIAGQYDNGQMLTGKDGAPLPFGDIRGDKPKAASEAAAN